MGSFQKRCALFFQALVCCALCGACKVGGCNSFHKYKLQALSDELPPYALANAAMEPFTHQNGQWWLCPTCLADRTRRSCYEVRVSPDYSELLYSADPLEVCTLSLLDVCVEFSKRWNGFAHGIIVSSTILSHPLVSWARHNAVVNMPLEVQTLLAQNICSNPLFKAYKCVLERPGNNALLKHMSSICALLLTHLILAMFLRSCYCLLLLLPGAHHFCIIAYMYCLTNLELRL